MTGTEGDKQVRSPATNPGRTGVSGAELASGGIQFAVILVLSSFAGMWLDRHIGTSPWFLIVLVFLGAAAAFFSLYHKLMKGQRLGERRKTPDPRKGSGS
jgi:F0F1-type ATP synthase assembly protein I